MNASWTRFCFAGAVLLLGVGSGTRPAHADVAGAPALEDTSQRGPRPTQTSRWQSAKRLLDDAHTFSNGLARVREMADGGYLPAETFLGRMLLRGDKVKQDLVLAERYLASAAEKDSRHAQCLLAQAYLFGPLTTNDQAEVKAVGLIGRAASNDVAWAQHALARAYYTGFHLPQNATNAFEWMQKSAAKGYPRAECQLGDFLLQGEGCEKDVHEAVKCYERAASNDFAEAFLALGDCHYFGNGVPENPAEAFTNYNRACDRGVTAAFYKLGICYEWGTGTEKDESAAFAAYEQSANAGHAEGLYALGMALSWGMGCEQDLERAARCFKAAADKGLIRGTYALGTCYEWGRGVEKDPDRAMELYTEAEETGNSFVVESLKSSRLWLERRPKPQR